MHKYLFLLLVAFTFLWLQPAAAQEAIEISKLLENDGDISMREMSRVNRKVIVDDSLDGWDLAWEGGLNGAQAAYSNWSQGGVNSISMTASTIYDMKYRKDKFAYAFSTNLKYGRSYIEGEQTRKTDDRLAVNNKVSYLFPDERWSAFGNINFATQIDFGYNYNVPDDEDPELISKFFAPAYFTQITGIGYSPIDYFSAEAGLAMKQTIISDTTLSERYGLDPGQQFRFEPGYAVAMNFEKTVLSNVRLRSSLETFTNLQNNIKSTDIYFSNELIGKINDHLNMSFQFVAVYDEDFNRELQIKQVLSAGLSISIM